MKTIVVNDTEVEVTEEETQSFNHTTSRFLLLKY